ncbi:50S ribosomal protein L25/general stress protein Ctc [Thermosulfuriphilus ammonigenes]|uniref:Large ribosomal subunit protein bL25 n=1 Tax=Thermosulfuriphilus ammonigenes TaxID=1936021 RepID=A0A6G7PXJ6_9BACT|nr:50S ribosomal protein L25/general stress protein Ctc [Thermosulfuriphilus ammonigenes]MBA2849302.1 large subunit ribosomal protein L25 [Thermosulfuriphilus ammonigenes]QIJ72382.1 50S ribosomal protein L25/general stress protein Ctc [Thermosulfuriphilus ammonigenes]
MKQVEMTVQVREKTGKEVARKLRRQGLLPAIIYGRETENIPLAVEANELKKILFRHRGEQLIFNLNLKNNGSESRKMAIVKEIQAHPVTDEPLHVDFYEVSLEREIEVEVPVEIVGKAKGMERGGILEVITRELTISCLPMAIPNSIKIDVSSLDIGDSFHVEDLPAMEGIRVLDPPKTTILTIVSPEEEEEAPTEEALETEVIAKGKKKEESE